MKNILKKIKKDYGNNVVRKGLMAQAVRLFVLLKNKIYS